MIHFHGTPISGSYKDILPFFNDRYFIVSFYTKGNYNQVTKLSKGYIIDNGAYSIWNKGEGDIDINKYMDFIYKNECNENYLWNFIPDKIDGNAKDNCKIIEYWANTHGKSKSVPVYHYHEPLHFLRDLIIEFPLVGLGSSSEYNIIGSELWTKRTNEIFNYAESLRIDYRFHGLRMLNRRIFTKYNYFSGDSTNIARNINMYMARHNIKTRIDSAFCMATYIEKEKSLYSYSDNEINTIWHK